MKSEANITPHSSYRFDDLMKFFNARRETYNTNPQLIDEVIYTPYSYDPSNPQTGSGAGRSTEIPPTGDLLGTPDLLTESAPSPRAQKRSNKFTETPAKAEVFLFEYGTIVVWGMTETEEKRFLSSMWGRFLPSVSYPIHSQVSRKRFEVERLGKFSNCFRLPASGFTTSLKHRSSLVRLDVLT